MRWLKEKYPCDNSNCTHPILTGGRLYVLGTQYPEFIKDYAKLASQGSVHISERPLEDISPIKIDIDLTFKEEILLDNDDISNIAQAVRDALLRLTPDAYSHQIYVMEKCPTLPSLKKGLHIMCPTLVVDHTYEFVLREFLLTRIEPVLIGMETTTPVDKAIDEGVILRSGWLLYGSKKANDLEPYRVTHIYTITGEGIEEDSPEAFESLPFEDKVSLFSLRNKSRSILKFTDEALDRSTVINYRRTEEILRKKKLEAMTIEHGAPPGSSRQMNPNSTFTKFAEELVEKCLDPMKRAHDYYNWFLLGACLHSIDDSLLDVWDKFSERCPDKYQPGACARQWRYFRVYGFQMNKLKKWAEEDNPEEFKKICSSNKMNMIISYESINPKDPPSDHTMSEILRFFFQERYVVVSGKGKQNLYFYYDRNKWSISAGCDTPLFHAIRYDFLDELNKISYELIRNNPSDFQKVISKITPIKTNIEKTAYTSKMIRELNHKLWNKEFENLIESMPHLICFENGVFDLNLFEFREGHPSDYCLFSTGYNYVEYDPSLPIYTEIENYLEKVFINPRVRTYVLKLVASFLNGGLPKQEFHFWTGSGSNSKSLFINLIQSTFGGYSTPMPSTTFTRKQNAPDAPNPHLVELRNKRFSPMSELPEHGSTMHVGLMKQLTGQDVIKVRGLYENNIEFQARCGMVYAANDLPSITDTDEGTWRRIVVVNFASKFLNDEDFNHEPGTFVKDFNLDQKMKEWPPYFMAILLQYYKRFKEEGNTRPEEVNEPSRKFRENSDVIRSFINKYLEIYEGSSLAKTTLLATFENETKLSFKTISNTKELFHERMLRTIGSEKVSMEKGHYINLRLKNAPEEE